MSLHFRVYATLLAQNAMQIDSDAQMAKELSEAVTPSASSSTNTSTVPNTPLEQQTPKASSTPVVLVPTPTSTVGGDETSSIVAPSRPPPPPLPEPLPPPPPPPSSTTTTSSTSSSSSKELLSQTDSEVDVGSEPEQSQGIHSTTSLSQLTQPFPSNSANSNANLLFAHLFNNSETEQEEGGALMGGAG